MTGIHSGISKSSRCVEVKCDHYCDQKDQSRFSLDLLLVKAKIFCSSLGQRLLQESGEDMTEVGHKEMVAEIEVNTLKSY